jgi:hypothetical protein
MHVLLLQLAALSRFCTASDDKAPPSKYQNHEALLRRQHERGFASHSAGLKRLSLTRARMISHLTAFSSLLWRHQQIHLEPHRPSQHTAFERREGSIQVSIRNNQ